ncbi:MAG: Hsp20/alpha crystallin family protein [Pseudomonadota bacterium]
MFKKKKQKEKESEEPFELDFGMGKIGLGGLFEGFGKLVDLAEKLEEAGGEMKKQGEFKVKGMKDIRGVYGFSVRTGIGRDGREAPIVEPFGNIKKTPRGAVVEDTREPIVDLFEEDDKVQIVAEMPGVSEEEVECELKGDVLILNSSGEKKYNKEILLPYPVLEEGMEKSYKNGIFELKFKKK